ncbi:hypothetical protein U9M48_029399, partial [Paspalum notatum var. saurae]
RNLGEASKAFLFLRSGGRSPELPAVIVPVSATHSRLLGDAFSSHACYIISILRPIVPPASQPRQTPVIRSMGSMDYIHGAGQQQQLISSSAEPQATKGSVPGFMQDCWHSLQWDQWLEQAARGYGWPLETSAGNFALQNSNFTISHSSKSRLLGAAGMVHGTRRGKYSQKKRGSLRVRVSQGCWERKQTISIEVRRQNEVVGTSLECHRG